MKKEWAEFLLDEYQRCRLWPGWKQMYDLHDREDQIYYDNLDRMGMQNKVLMISPDPLGDNNAKKLSDFR